MHDSCVNYPNELKLCKENHTTGKVNCSRMGEVKFVEDSFKRYGLLVVASYEHTLLCDITVT